jgi:hypothetical protein
LRAPISLTLCTLYSIGAAFNRSRFPLSKKDETKSTYLGAAFEGGALAGVAGGIGRAQTFNVGGVDDLLM